MKYFGRMITKLLVNNEFIEEEEKIEIQKEFDASFEKQAKSENKIVKVLNGVFSHPFGVLMSILLYVFVNRKVKESGQSSDINDFEHEFKLEMKKKMYNELLEE